MHHFLGIQLDSTLMELRLPAVKLLQLKSLIASWLDEKAATKRDLQMIIGHLSHATIVVQPRRTFIRGLIEAPKIPKRPNHWDLNCQADLAWCNMFLDKWNGTSVMPPPQNSVVSTSDASESWGYQFQQLLTTYSFNWSGPPHLISTSCSIAGGHKCHYFGPPMDGQTCAVPLSQRRRSVSTNPLLGKRTTPHTPLSLSLLYSHLQIHFFSRTHTGKHKTLADTLSSKNVICF